MGNIKKFEKFDITISLELIIRMQGEYLNIKSERRKKILLKGFISRSILELRNILNTMSF